MAIDIPGMKFATTIADLPARTLNIINKNAVSQGITPQEYLTNRGGVDLTTGVYGDAAAANPTNYLTDAAYTAASQSGNLLNALNQAASKTNTLQNNGQAQATTPTITPGGGGNSSALQIITDALTGAGLGSLAANAWTMWNKGYDINAIMDDPTNGIRASAAYKTVFPAMAKLNAMGEGITEGEYLAKVKADKEILKQFNVPSGIFDTPDYLGSLMLNHVNTVDLTNRLQAAQDSVLSLDPSILKYGKDSYGLDTGNLIAWALDPTKATPIIVQQAKAMQIGGAALQSGFAGGMGTNGELLASQAEALANQGVTQAQALQGFTQLGQMSQYGQMLPGDVSGALTGQQMVNAEFNANANDVMALNKVKATRVNEFNAGGALAANAGGVGGIGAANLQA